MKQRGIASFFGGGKAENNTRGLVAKAGKSAVSKPQDSSEVLKDANSSANKRSREVIIARNASLVPNMPHLEHAYLSLWWSRMPRGQLLLFQKLQQASLSDCAKLPAQRQLVK